MTRNEMLVVRTYGILADAGEGLARAMRLSQDLKDGNEGRIFDAMLLVTRLVSEYSQKVSEEIPKSS